MNPYRKIQNFNYEINDLIIDGENALKNSSLIKSILQPPQSLEDKRNPNGPAQYRRYVNQAQFSNYPLIALVNALGLTNKGDAEVIIPPSMESLIENATLQNTPLSKIQDDLMKDIFFFGSGMIRVVISDDMPLNEPPKLEAISAKKIIDFHTKIEFNREIFDWVLLDDTKNIFDPNTKNYQILPLYKILALDAENNYYEAIFPQINWKTFDILHPYDNKEALEVVYPAFFDYLHFVPVVGVNARTVEFRYHPAYLQDLIDLSLSIFNLDADLRMGLYMQSNPFLAIYGSNLDTNEIVQGMFAVNIFSDTGAKAEFVAPNCAGMQLQLDKLNEMKTDAKNKVYDIIQTAGNASGDALALRINSGTTSLINVVQTIGLAIKKALQMIALIMQENPDTIDYIPYVDFAQIQTGNEIKDEEMKKNEENNEENEDKKDNLENNEENLENA